MFDDLYALVSEANPSWDMFRIEDLALSLMQYVASRETVARVAELREAALVWDGAMWVWLNDRADKLQVSAGIGEQGFIV